MDQKNSGQNWSQKHLEQIHLEPGNTGDQNVTAHQFTALSTILHFVPPIYTLHYHNLPFARLVLYLDVRLKRIKFAISTSNCHTIS